ncbi:aldehyde dehydrogenase family protein [Kutzneria kofuensis]|uniref:Acyl-CoA reductase-like NAD-dependent aldehyde dehydrogenase n=1 Tax=Kutzneria kofuensis TaxID=103725 RepID=A0A7W9KRA4_9PSEU|nr:aldehyde dehydrogenase family protein [Kutzneria kofuensis]MBB5897190.1 acyl-CoA reductase-like NAD-dependent aldehyde dehydrogenase [Kutzneria kofuensis]
MSEVEQVVAAARAAQRGWARTPAAERGAALAAAAARLRSAADELAAANNADTGRLIDEARGGVLAAAGTLDQYAELGPLHRGRVLHGAWSATDLMVPEPRGVVAAITPWNDPVAIACGLIGAALAVGNAVVHKPSERSPHVGELLTKLLADLFPEHVLQWLPGDGWVGEALASQPGVDVVAHVGSTATGREIARNSTAKLLLENGGNDPLLVDEGVDPAWAASQAALGAFTNAGQLCTSVERVFVHEAVAKPFLEALQVEAQEFVTGPLVDVRARDSVHGQVQEAVRAGASLVTGGTVLVATGSHYPNTVLSDCTPEMRVMREETFGPVAPVCVVDSFDHGLELACSGPYGLAATVLTRDMDHAQRAWRELPVGTVKINAVFGGAPGGAAQPRGASGTGFGYGPELLDEMTTMKVVHWEAAC